MNDRFTHTTNASRDTGDQFELPQITLLDGHRSLRAGLVPELVPQLSVEEVQAILELIANNSEPSVAMAHIERKF